MLPAYILPALLMFVSWIFFLLSWIPLIISKRHVAVTTLLFVGGLVFFSASIRMCHAYLYQRGFCHFAKTVLSADEWRSISRVAQEQIKPEGSLFGPGMNHWAARADRDVWSKIAASTKIGKLEPSLMIFVRANATDIIWGGELTGNRGVRIFTKKSDENVEGHQLREVFITEDIAVVVAD